MKICS